MSIRIYKYRLIGPSCCIAVPVFSRFLSIKEQDGGIVAYFLLSKVRTTETYVFDCFNTGDTAHKEMNPAAPFAGTVSIGGVVQHVFYHVE
jgi:hypothetical protein